MHQNFKNKTNKKSAKYKADPRGSLTASPSEFYVFTIRKTTSLRSPGTRSAKSNFLASHHLGPHVISRGHAKLLAQGPYVSEPAMVFSTLTTKNP